MNSLQQIVWLLLQEQPQKGWGFQEKNSFGKREFPLVLSAMADYRSLEIKESS